MKLAYNKKTKRRENLSNISSHSFGKKQEKNLEKNKTNNHEEENIGKRVGKCV